MFDSLLSPTPQSRPAVEKLNLSALKPLAPVATESGSILISRNKKQKYSKVRHARFSCCLNQVPLYLAPYSSTHMPSELARTNYMQEIELSGSMLRSLAKDTMAHTVLHPLKDATCILKFPVQQLQGATKKPKPRVLELNLAKVSILALSAFCLRCAFCSDVHMQKTLEICHPPQAKTKEEDLLPQHHLDALLQVTPSIHKPRKLKVRLEKL
jgi:hypothetical protein